MTLRLMEGEQLDRYSAAKTFKVKHATAHRSLALIHAVIPGVIVRKTDSPKTYRFENAASRPPKSASLTLALAATFGAASSRVLRGTAYDKQLREFSDRTIEQLTADGRSKFQQIDRKLVVLPGEEEVRGRRCGVLDEVIDAILRQEELEVRYREFNGKVSTFVLRPYSLIVGRSRLYVVAPKPGFGPYPFRFQRILSANRNGKLFEYPKRDAYDPERLLRDSFGIFVDPDPVDVVVRLAPRWKTYARHHKWHRSQRVVKTPTGIDIHLHVRPCAELKQWILSFGEDAEVIEPTELRSEIAGRLATAAARYRCA